MRTQRLAAGMGQVCRIALPSSPSGGVAWYSDGGNAEVRIQLESDEVSSSRPGRHQVFVVVGEIPGDYELHFVLKRTWESVPRSSWRVLFHVSAPRARGRIH